MKTANHLMRWAACSNLAHIVLAGAQPAPISPDLIHRIRAGETLYSVAEKYTGQPDRWAEVQRYNRIEDARRLVPGTPIRIPSSLRGGELSTFATAAYVMGDVRYARPGDTQANPLQTGARLTEGTRIEVGAEAYVRLEMIDGSVVRMPAGTVARLARVRSLKGGRTAETLIQLEAGNLDASVHPMRGRSGAFEIHTPLAIATVRGTEFHVGVKPDAAVTSEVTQGIVLLRGKLRGKGQRGAASRQLRAGQGAGVDSTGGVGPVRTLAKAPDLSALPITVSDADFVRLSLPASPGIASYRVEIATDEALRQVVRSGMSGPDGVQFAGLDDGIYTIGVRAIDAAGLLGAERRRTLRVKARPVAPLFQQPGRDEKVVGESVELACTQPTDAQRFKLQISKDEMFQMLEVNESALTACRYRAILSPGRYFWRLASVRLLEGNVEDQGPFSRSQGFDVEAAPPGTPAMAASGEDGSVSVSWAGVPGDQYLVQVARDSAFADLLYDQMQTEFFLSLPGQLPGTYYVRIRPINAQGLFGAVSPAQAVQVGAVVRDSSGNAVRDSEGKALRRK
jgi:hypothetical protein